MNQHEISDTRIARELGISVHRVIREAGAAYRILRNVPGLRDLFREVVSLQRQRAVRVPDKQANKKRLNRPIKFTPTQVREIRAALAAGAQQSTVAERYGISKTHISRIANGKGRRDA